MSGLVAVRDASTDTLGLYVRLVGAGLRAQMQYKVSFLLETVATFVGTALDFVAIVVFFNRFEHIGGWSIGEVTLLYGLVGISFALAQFVGSGFEEFDEVVRRGTFDQVLVKPRSALLQVMGAQLPLRRMGRFLQAAGALALAQYWLGLQWTLPKALFAAWTVFGGALFFLGLFLVRAAVCFFTVESVEAINILTYGGQEMAGYPMHIFAPWMRRIFVYFVPLAFVNYFPALVLLDRPNPLGGPPAAAALAVPLCAAVFGVGLLCWRIGVRHYQSTGS